MASTNQTGEAGLRRELGVWLGIFITINVTVGTGIFKTPAQIAREVDSVEAYLLIWVAGGVIAACGALSLSELGAAMPRTGGIYEYLRRAWGPAPAFVFGWANLTLLIPSSVGSFGRIAAEAISALLGLPANDDRDTGMAIGIIAICVIANLWGVRTSATAQSVISAAKYAGVILLAALGLFLAGGAADPAAVTAPVPAGSWAGAFAALVAVMWAYDGLNDLTRVAGEVKDPGRTMPRAIIAGSAAVLTLYLLANAGYLNGLGLDGLRASTTGSNMAGANLAAAALGAAGRTLVAGLILVSCLGACMTTLLTNPRTFVPMATDGVFFRRLGSVSPRTGTPIAAVVICGGLGCGYVLFRSFEQLSNAFVVGFMPFSMLAVAGVFVLRRREPELPRPFRVPGYPVTPILLLIGGALVSLDRTALIAFAVVGSGIPVHFLWQRLAPRSE